MKRIILSIVTMALLASTAAAQQIYRTAYFMEGSTMRNHLNPAFRSDRGYVNIPVAGNITMNFMSESLSLGNLFYPMDNGKTVSLLDKSVTWDMISPKLQKSNGLNLDIYTSVLGFGFYAGKSFITFDLGLQTEFGFKMPKEMFEFIKVGSGSYDMKDISLGGTVTMNASLGYSRRIFENLTVGARFNFLAGLARANMHYEKLNLTLNRDMWSVEATGNLDVAMSGFAIPDKEDEPGVIDLSLNNADFKVSDLMGLAGQGFSVDLGAEYIILDRIKVSASVLNMGFMRWNKKALTSGQSVASYTFSGVDVTTDGEGTNVGEVNTDFDAFTKFNRVERNSNLKSKVFATFVAGAEIDIFGNDLLGFGLIYTNKKTEFVRKSEIAAALTVRPTKWVSASVSYAFETRKSSDTSFNTFGAALNLHPCWINFFIGTDFMFKKVSPEFIPIDQRMMNLYLGIAIPLAREKEQKMIKLGI